MDKKNDICGPAALAAVFRRNDDECEGSSGKIFVSSVGYPARLWCFGVSLGCCWLLLGVLFSWFLLQIPEGGIYWGLQLGVWKNSLYHTSSLVGCSFSLLFRAWRPILKAAFFPHLSVLLCSLFFLMWCLYFCGVAGSLTSAYITKNLYRTKTKRWDGETDSNGNRLTFQIVGNLRICTQLCGKTFVWKRGWSFKAQG